MGINVCVKVISVVAEVDGENNRINFNGKVKLLVVDEDERAIKEVEWYLGGIEEFLRASDCIGKVGYAAVEKIEGVPKVWFLDESPFDDEWREELLMA